MPDELGDSTRLPVLLFAVALFAVVLVASAALAPTLPWPPGPDPGSAASTPTDDVPTDDVPTDDETATAAPPPTDAGTAAESGTPSTAGPADRYGADGPDVSPDARPDRRDDLTAGSFRDRDGDGLTDAAERRYGTDPASNDTDGDLLLDGAEVRGRTAGGAALPAANPRRKDIYVHVAHGADLTGLTAEERATLRYIFVRMPVDNPGRPGISLHLVGDEELPTTPTVANRDDRSAVREKLYTGDRLGARQCVYREVVLGRVDNASFSGFADTPGYFVFVDGTLRGQYTGTVPYRVRTVAHELLHTVVGVLPHGPGVTAERTHTTEGWLSYEEDLTVNEHLSEAAADHLNATGFDGTPGVHTNC